MINREKGSGIRIFIDEMCKKLDIDPDRSSADMKMIASSHLIAATNVLRGTCRCGDRKRKISPADGRHPISSIEAGEL